MLARTLRFLSEIMMLSSISPFWLNQMGTQYDEQMRGSDGELDEGKHAEAESRQNGCASG